MPATDILRRHGKWIQSKVFVSLVAKELGISEKQAYRKINKARKSIHAKEKILRVTLPDRKVLYGLAEFGPPVKEETSKKPSEINYNRLRFLIEHKIVNSELAETLLNIKALEEVKPELKKDREIQLLKKVVEALCGLESGDLY